MNSKRPRVVVTGYIGLLPAGGVTWDYIQYPLGFHELGCDVLYLEDTMQWPVYQNCDDGVSCGSNVAHLDAVMRQFGLEGRWAYRDAVTDRLFGIEERTLAEFCRTADLLVNVSCSTPLRQEYLQIPLRALVDSDPMFTQVQCTSGRSLYGQKSALPEMVDAHTHLFTFGENIGAPDCEIPSVGRRWRRTRQPIVLRHWQATDMPSRPAAFTTVMNWTAANDFEFEGRMWGQKNQEFMKVIEVPRILEGTGFTVAVGQTTGVGFPAAVAEGYGWKVIGASSLGSPDSYRKFIEQSRGEFSVAKHTYVQARTGWFSGRSACYLAMGRPVVAQETGWSEYVSTGCGLFSFSDPAEGVEAVKAIEREPQRHSVAARQVAQEFFDSDKLLRAMLTEVGL